MIIGVCKETYAGERRVALNPDVVPSLTKQDIEVLIETRAGEQAGFPDEAYAAKGARTGLPRREVFENADAGRADLEIMRAGQVLIGLCDPLGAPELAKELADRGVTSFSMELVPRIARAQSMDALSSMATIAGYKAVLLAAAELPRMFPMSMTAAGTIAPARVLVVGAGVAGLQAIASARRLGAVVSAYDVRPDVKQQVESLGARFVEMELEASEAQDEGGYARELGEDFYHKQRELMTRVVAASDVVITTAAIPGKRSPILITADMVKGMPTGSVIVDLAAERGGNCQLTKADQVVVHHGVTILGPSNLPATVPYHASQMYAKNISTFLLHLVEDGQLKLDLEDEITRDTLITHDGKVVHPEVCELLGIEPPSTTKEAEADPGTTATDAGNEATDDDDVYEIAEGEDD